jgi:hypothetical protein
MRNRFHVQFLAEGDSVPFDVLIAGYRRSVAISRAANEIRGVYPNAGRLRLASCTRTSFRVPDMRRS